MAQKKKWQTPKLKVIAVEMPKEFIKSKSFRRGRKS